MGEETSNTMNLDLNLAPGPEPENNNEIGIADGLPDETRRLRDLASGSISVELNETMDSLGNVSSLQLGEGRVGSENGRTEEPKTSEINNMAVEDETTKVNDGSFFDCNICLELAKDPVITCCGHLFCWPCLYRWLHYHSEAKECPVCKGEVTVQTVTPIYGRGVNLHEPEEDGDFKIPLRPQARNVESLRDTIQRIGFTFPLDLTRDEVHPQVSENSRGTFGRAHVLLNRFMRSGGLRRAEQPALGAESLVDLTRGDISGNSARDRPMADEDRGSFSSIIAVSNSGNQIDTAMNDGSRIPDVDSRGSRPPRARRRRLN